MPRSARLDAPGVLHHVIIRGIERHKIFRDEVDCEDLVGRLSQLLPSTQTACYAWVFLRNHAHFVLRSGPRGIAFLMPRLLTGCAGCFNRRHRRHGQLFQKRYKSIVCQEDVYLKQLVAYIHLNPLRARIVPDLAALGDYPYCGHGALIGNVPVAWQDTDYVLRQFGERQDAARRNYFDYVGKSAESRRRPELVGGGVVRGPGGWKEKKPVREKGMARIKGDARILGESSFVEDVLRQSQQALDARYALRRAGWDFDRVLGRVAVLCRVPPERVLSGWTSAAAVHGACLMLLLGGSSAWYSCR